MSQHSDPLLPIDPLLSIEPSQSIRSVDVCADDEGVVTACVKDFLDVETRPGVPLTAFVYGNLQSREQGLDVRLLAIRIHQEQ